MYMLRECEVAEVGFVEVAMTIDKAGHGLALTVRQQMLSRLTEIHTVDLYQNNIISFNAEPLALSIVIPMEFE